MNKTFNINLGGYPFTIDEDAFETANRYLHTLGRHFGSGEGATEIMQDIENRMGELISRKKGTRQIVSKLDVLEAIAVLGTPEELKDINFADDSQAKKATSSFQLKTGKRLFRDTNDKILGGVCSGLAAYFGIQDVVWVRIAFFIFTMLGGSGVIIYLVLWAIIPPARTVSDRLEMMGEPTNVNNIARMVKEELEQFSDNMKEKFGKKNKRRHHHTRPPGDDDPEQILTSGWSWDFHEKKKAPYNKKDFV
jgi:phage shock protein PspC (stress-responsive transcriptional regulator)